MMDITPIMPPKSALFERALAEAASDEFKVPFKTILDPYKTPVKFLPFLAHNHSVDLWFDDWSSDNKREMIAQCAGRSILYPNEQLADLKGTFKGLKRYLAFVGATIIDRISYPNHFIFNRATIGRTPIAHPAFKSRYLVQIEIDRPKNTFEIGRTGLNKAAFRDIEKTAIERAKIAARIARFEHVELVVSFAHKKSVHVGDEPDLNDNLSVGAYVDRQRI